LEPVGYRCDLHSARVRIAPPVTAALRLRLLDADRRP
jgi:hypothetical protein